MDAKPQRNPVSSNVRAEMARRGVTQARLAHQLGMAQQSLSRRLRGDTLFSVDELLRIANVLDVPAGELLGVA